MLVVTLPLADLFHGALKPVNAPVALGQNTEPHCFINGRPCFAR